MSCDLYYGVNLSGCKVAHSVGTCFICSLRQWPAFRKATISGVVLPHGDIVACLQTGRLLAVGGFGVQREAFSQDPAKKKKQQTSVVLIDRAF